MNPNDLLMGSGSKSASFPVIGTTVTGRIVREPKAQQQTDAKTNQPKTYDNGDPMMQIVAQLQTADRDPADPDDDGIRAVYIKSKMLLAVREAIKKSGAKGLEVGGELSITYTADGEKTNKAFNPPKLYAATYRPPSAEAANNVLMGSAPDAAQPAPAADGMPPGFDAGTWAVLDADQRAQVRAAMGLV